MSPTPDITNLKNSWISIEDITCHLEKSDLSSEPPIETEIIKSPSPNGLISINFLSLLSRWLIKDKNIGSNPPISNSPSTKKPVETGCKDSMLMKKLKISYPFWSNNSIDGPRKITSISPITCSWEKLTLLWANVVMKTEWELETFLVLLPSLPPVDYWLNKIVMKFSLLFTLLKADNPPEMYPESPLKNLSEFLTCSTISPNSLFPSMMV